MGLFPPSVEYALVGVPRSKGSKIIVVDAVNGSDANSGLKWEAPLASIEAAYAKTTTLKNDVILLVGNGTSNTAAAAMVWANDFTHLIGLSAPLVNEQRSRIRCGAALATTPFITWSADGCVVKNVSFWHETTNAAGLVNVLVSGGRNYFEHCSFAGAIGANNATGARSLVLDDATCSGNVFKGCTIGNDTIQIVAGVHTLEISDGAMHNLFEDCYFLHSAGATTNCHVFAAAAADVGRLNMFRRCLFINETSVAQAEVILVTAALGQHQHLILDDCWFYGAAEWNLGNHGVVINNNHAAIVTGVATSGLMKITS
jgi:hypothetical protein